jgi:hypothetical protein
MLSFKQFITEEKNLHLTHLEDSILDLGVDGTRSAINFLRSLRDMLAGRSKKSVNVTVKWDGAPAVFAGIVPNGEENAGKFFVAKKGVFNAYPKYYTTNADIDADTSGDLNIKLKLALAELPKLGIRGVIQGDFLYAKEDLKEINIGGESYITFHPNTIVYAVPKNSELAKEILRSKIGVVWHTRYRGDSFEAMSASFGEEIASGLKKVRSVWSVDAIYQDVSGTANLTAAETEQVTKILSQAGKLFNTIKKETFNGIGENEERRIRVNTFVNSKIRKGERIRNPSVFVNELITYLNDFYQKEADKKKTEAGKKSTMVKRDVIMEYFDRTPRSQIVALFTLYNLIVDAKHIIISKLDKAKRVGTFLKTSDGYQVTSQEGFVAIDHLGKNAVKLVDRLEFSKANFSPEYLKGWQR